MNNGEKNSRLPIYTRLNENGRVSSYTKLSNKDEKYKIYLVRKYNDSSDEAEELLREDEDREKWETAMKKNQKKKSCCGRVCNFFYRCRKSKNNKNEAATALANAGRKSFFEKFD